MFKIGRKSILLELLLMTTSGNIFFDHTSKKYYEKISINLLLELR